MRRIFGILAVTAATGALVVVGSGASDEESGGYLVRAIFDNGSFVVADEEVRIAGAKVGTVESVDVTIGDERAHEDGSPDPGKAVVVMRITDPGFQDFREDASCLIRPQSLLGEKFVECEATQPRAPGAAVPPELEVIPEGETGEGQHFLPVEQNGKAVDLDLINNIMREPYPDRFRLILNELGIGLATRGEDIEEIVERGNPALRETNELLTLLKGQTEALNRMAADGDRALAPLAEETEAIKGFINNANTAGEATAARIPELEAGLERMPAFFREIRITMPELQNFTDQATPVIANLGDAGPALARATRALGPFSRAGIPAFRSLGDAAETAGPDLVASVPVIKDLRRLANETVKPSQLLKALLTNLREQDTYENLIRFFFYGTGAANGYDNFGHYLRAVVPVNNCFVYTVTPESGCEANFPPLTSAARQAQLETQNADWDLEALLNGEGLVEEGAAPAEEETALEGGGAAKADEQDTGLATKRDSEILMDFLMGDGGGR